MMFYDIVLVNFILSNYKYQHFEWLAIPQLDPYGLKWLDLDSKMVL